VKGDPSKNELTTEIKTTSMGATGGVLRYVFVSDVSDMGVTPRSRR
jgi:hypothetical protein